MAADDAFQRRLLRALGRAAVKRVRPKIVSYKGKPVRALQKALRAVVIDDTTLQLKIPHFWSVFVHEGRRIPVSSKFGVLIWFRDPKRDPRLDNGVTQVNESELRHLNAAEFKEARAENYEAQLQGRAPPVIIIPAGLIRRATPPSPFFGNEPGGGMFGFDKQADQIVQDEFQHFALSSVRRDLGIKSFIPRIPSGGTIHLTVEHDEVHLTI